MGSVSPSFFEIVNYTPPDAIFELTKTYNADPDARKVASCQALSGTGALHIAGTLLKQALGCDTTVYITKPSWSNHRQVFESIGFAVREFNYSSDAGVDMQSLVQTLEEAAPKSIFVFHASAHNPSGWDCRLTSGDYDRDAFAIRYFADELGLEIAVCLSFAKSMGLYGERVGLCAFSSNTPTIAAAVESSLARMIRAEISNPPAFGARIVAAVLEDEEFYAQWRKDLVTMSSRIAEMRWQLYQGLTKLCTPGDWKRITEQKGMFCILGLTPDQVHHLQKEYHIYMAESSRVSIAGLNGTNVRYVAECINQTVTR
ncbi:hypothetical protein HAV15_005727 [Penicillium sp. str. |nr:hypothetical protein HAV15_005727 [Penicillium sp. str. \